MSLTIQASANSSREFEIAPAGNHVAICYAMVDLGHQKTMYRNRDTGVEEEKLQHKAYIGWELCNEPMADGRPFMVSRQLTMSLHEKATMRAILESWRGRPFTDDELTGFDLKNILGKPCMVNVVHNTAKNGKTYANIASVAAIPKGMPVPEQTNSTLLFEFGDMGFDESAFNALPQWMQSKIMESKEYRDMTNDAPVEGPAFDDDIAF
jgi:hypothetical protein